MLDVQKAEKTFTSVGQGPSESLSDVGNKIMIKEEPVFVAENAHSMHQNSEIIYCDDSDLDQLDTYDHNEEVYYGNPQSQRRTDNRYRNDAQLRHYGGSKKVFVKRNQYQLPRKNPIDSYGNTLHCDFCSSEYHLIANCHDCPKQLKEKFLAKRYNRSASSQSQYI